MRTIRDYIIAHPLVDVPLAIVIGILVVHYAKAPLAGASGQPVFFQTAAGVCAAAVGFGVTAVTILVSITPGARLQAVIERSGLQLVRILMSLVGSLVACACGFAAYSIGVSQNPVLLVGLVIISTLAVTAQFRLVWIFYQVFALIVVESKRPSS